MINSHGFLKIAEIQILNIFKKKLCSNGDVLGDGAPRGPGLLSLLYIVFFWGGLGEVWGGVIASCGLRCQ